LKPAPAARTFAFAATAVALLVCCASEQPAPVIPRGSDERPPEVVVPQRNPLEFDVTTEAWTFEDKEGIVVTTPHYRIYTTTTRQGLKDRIPKFMEAALMHYRSALAPLPLPTSPLETYLLSNRPQWTRITQRLMGADAAIYLRIQRGGFAADGRAILYEIGPHDTYAIAAHEGWHQFTQRTFRNPLPIWLEEGLACYMEGFRWTQGDSTLPNFMPWANIERFDELRSAARSERLLTLDQLTRTSPQELMANDADLALTYYAQLWALVHYLNEGEEGRHRDSLRQVILDAQAGRLIERIRRTSGGRAASIYASRRLAPGLLEGWFGEPTAELNIKYRAFIADITRIGGKESIVAGRTPVSEVGSSGDN